MKILDPLELPLFGTALIEASAGTGKTYTITTLCLRLLLERRLSMRDILVVTYTKAATAELRGRVRARLLEAVTLLSERGSGSSGGFRSLGTAGSDLDPTLRALFAERTKICPPEQDRVHLLEALRSFDENAIYTIHGFCQRMLLENTFESAMSFETRLVADQQALLEEVVLDFWSRELTYAPASFAAFLLEKRVSPKELLKTVARASADPWLTISPASVQHAVPAAEVAFFSALAEAEAIWSQDRSPILRLLFRSPSLDRAKYPQDLIQRRFGPELDQLFQRKRPRLADAFPHFIRFCRSSLEEAARGLGAAPAHRFFEACESLREADRKLAEELERARLALTLDLLKFARRELAIRKTRSDSQSYDDLLFRLCDALDSPALAGQLSRRFPAALIDEFQDTDAVQYEIFRKIYGRLGRDPTGALFLIGDPKQAVYAFRGADIFTYMRAASDAAAERRTLSVNHRSTPRLVQAINALFVGARAPFIFEPITYPPVTAGQNEDPNLSKSAPFEILLVPRNGDTVGQGGRINKGWGELHLPKLVAFEIVRLLSMPERIGKSEVRPGDVAVLCRTNAQTRTMQEALRRLGVPSVVQGDASVFDTREARDLDRLLRALVDPADRRSIRVALTTPALGINGDRLAALAEDEDAWDVWVSSFVRWHHIFAERGFIQAMQRLLDEREVEARLLAFPDGERRLTNFLHLLELLQTASIELHLGPRSLLEWFKKMRSEPNLRSELVAESAQLRLESDEHAVKLVTVHKAKGLEYPLVFCPFFWDGALLRDGDAVYFHDPLDGDRSTLDLGSDPRAKLVAEREVMAENLRLLYVALTRAKLRTTVIWGAFNEAETSPLAYLFHQPPSFAPATSVEPTGLIEATKERCAGLTDGELWTDLRALSARSGQSIAVRPIDFEAPSSYVGTRPAPPALLPRVSKRTLHFTDSHSSFSRLVANVGPLIPDEARDPDLREGPSESVPNENGPELPRGAAIGLLLHEVLEQVDFQRLEPESLDPLVGALLLKHGLPDAFANEVERLVLAALRAQLAGEDAGFALSDVGRAHRRSELEFVFSAGQTEPVTPKSLERVLVEHESALPKGYPQLVGRLPFGSVSGFMRGFIDLVFEHAGRWYVVDYKSNFLGSRAEDYREPALLSVMCQEHYLLQGLIYTVALHRHLGSRLQGYNFASHFGGAMDLFLRGMEPGKRRGIFTFSPTPELITSLSALFGGEDDVTGRRSPS